MLSVETDHPPTVFRVALDHAVDEGGSDRERTLKKQTTSYHGRKDN